MFDFQSMFDFDFTMPNVEFNVLMSYYAIMTSTLLYALYYTRNRKSVKNEDDNIAYTLRNRVVYK